MLSGLHWVIPGKLAGSGRPGLLASVEDDIDHIVRLGIRHVVTLTENPVDFGAEDPPFTVAHLPIADMGVPTPRALLSTCEDVVRHIDDGERVLVHCKAGLGRTGTVLAGCLVLRGLSASDAIQRIRMASPGSIQTRAQEQFVTHFAQYAESQRVPRPAPSQEPVA